MKKIFAIIALLGLIALPSNALTKKATLIKGEDKKVVEVGSQLSKYFFSVGYALFNGNIVGSNPGSIRNIIGTRVGTSTTGVNFYAADTINTYTTFVGDSVDSAIYTIKTTDASSTANVKFQLFASNDDQCDTASTSSNTVATVSQINWYDAAPFIVNLTASTTLIGIQSATTTIDWSPTAANQGKNLILNNINTRCLSLRVIASSTSLFAQLKTKTTR